MRTIVLLLFWVVTLPALSVHAASDADTRSAINDQLMQRHPKDNPAWWQGLGAGAPKVIIAMEKESDQTYVKMRLLQALAYFPEDPSADAFLKEQAGAATDDVIKHAAIRAVGKGWGDAEADWVGQFLDDKNPQTRLTAAEALQKMNSDAVRAKLDAYLKRERVPWIAAKVRGEELKPTAPLKIVASNDDQLAADWFGTWKGQWIEIKGAAPVNAELKIERDTPTGWHGALVLFTARKKETLRIPRASGKASRSTGVFDTALVVGGKETTPLEEAFEAELWLTRLGPGLLLRSSARAAVFVGQLKTE